ncbi:retrovirus-related pol polyprotein from transposon TNT 1-94 [Tanacetum coccineum]
MEAHELLANDKADSFLLKGLEKSINQSDLESCESLGNKSEDASDLEKPIWHSDSPNTPYPVTQDTMKPDGVESEHLYSASANEINEKKPELKSFPHHLEYVYLHGDKSFPIIISSELSKKEKMLLLQVLEKRKGVIAWKMSDIKGISPSFYTHKILMEDNFKPVIQPQRRLNPKVQDVVKNEIVKLLDSGLIYPISDSSWVSPIHVVPKKGGMTVVLNDDNELIPSYTRRMLFGLCNAPATFQICMTVIFHDMVEDFMEVFMDDFSVFGNSFDCCLANLDRMLARCEETNLVLNWEKCHFMTKECIVLGHKISGADHLSRLGNPYLGIFTEEEIIDEFPDEHLMVLKAKPNDDEPYLFIPMVAGQRKLEGQWTTDERKAANLDQHLKSLIMSILPDDQMNSVINFLTAKSTWDDLILYYEGPSDVKESRVLVNDGINLSKLEINIGFINGLPKKWLSFCQSLGNTNHVKDFELASLFGKLKYEENLIDSIYETEKKKSLISVTHLSTAFFSTSIIQDFQDSPDDQEDTRSSHEYLNDLEEEYQARALLAKSKRFFKKGTQRFSSAKATDQTECHKCGKKGHFTRDCWSKTSVPSSQSPFQSKSLSSPQHKPELRPTKDFEAKYNKVKAKLALLSLSASSSKASTVKNKGFIAEAYEWDEEEVSSDDNEMVEVKVLMALAEDNDAVSKKVPEMKRVIGVDQLTEDPSSSGQKDLVFVKSSADDTKVSIPSVEGPWLSKAEGFILPNHDTDESSVCNTPFPLLKKLNGVEPTSRPKTIKSISRSKSTFKAETLKGDIINKSSSAPDKGNKNSSTLIVNSAPVGEKVKAITTMGKENMKESVPRNLPPTLFLGHLKEQMGSPYRTRETVHMIENPEEIHNEKAQEYEGDMDVGWDITSKDVERRRQFLTPTIHTLPNLELVVPPCIPLGLVHNKDKIVREKEQDYDIPLNDSVMQPLTP